MVGKTCLWLRGDNNRAQAMQSSQDLDPSLPCWSRSFPDVQAQDGKDEG